MEDDGDDGANHSNDGLYEPVPWQEIESYALG